MKLFDSPGSSFLLGSFLFLFTCCNNNETANVNAEDTSAVKTDKTETPKAPDTPAPVTTPDTTPVAKTGHAQAMIEASFPDTAVTGTVNFDTLKSGKVQMKLELTIPSKAGKSVAVHLHEHGDCGNKAEMAHGHWNPTKAQHGKWDSGDFHMGDIGNVKLDSKGKGHLTIETFRWTLGGSWSKNIVGKSVIIHGGVDDYKTQPSGNSGARIGCGVIH